VVYGDVGEEATVGETLPRDGSVIAALGVNCSSIESTYRRFGQSDITQSLTACCLVISYRINGCCLDRWLEGVALGASSYQLLSFKPRELRKYGCGKAI
jgi:hypothetical protein